MRGRHGFAALVGRVLPGRVFGECEADLADQLATSPAPSNGGAAREAQASRAVFNAVDEGALEVVAYRRTVCRMCVWWYRITKGKGRAAVSTISPVCDNGHIIQ